MQYLTVKEILGQDDADTEQDKKIQLYLLAGDVQQPLGADEKKELKHGIDELLHKRKEQGDAFN